MSRRAPSRWRLRLWALQNWITGYKHGPVRRCRECDHTTPFHYGWCSQVAV